MFYSIISSFKGKVILLTDVFLDSKWFIVFGILIVYAVIYVLIIRVFVHFKYYYLNIYSNLYSRVKYVSEKSKKLKNPLKEIKNLCANIIILKHIYKSYTFLSPKISWNKFCILMLFISLLLYFLFQKVFSNFLSGVLIIICISIISILICYEANKRRIELIKQIPSFLEALGNALRAGYSLEQALIFIENEIDIPLQNEIHIITKNLRLNIPVNKVLQDFANKIQHRDVYFFTEGTIIQNKTGGNLVDLFKNIASIIEKRLKIKRDIDTFTSQGKYSSIIISSLWFFSLLLFYFVAPKHIEILFATSLGQTMLGISLMLELIGFFYIWRILHIKV